MANINIDDIAKEISKTLVEYTDDVKIEVARAADDLSKEGVKMLRAKSPKNTGKYSKSWTRKKGPYGYTLHNKVYQLTHLLEKGYAKKSGGRMPARVHIKPVEEQLVEDFERRIKEAIQR